MGVALRVAELLRSAEQPVGVQLLASHGDERTLLEIAYELEQAAPWRRITDK